MENHYGLRKYCCIWEGGIPCLFLRWSSAAPAVRLPTCSVFSNHSYFPRRCNAELAPPASPGKRCWHVRRSKRFNELGGEFGITPRRLHVSLSSRFAKSCESEIPCLSSAGPPLLQRSAPTLRILKVLFGERELPAQAGLSADRVIYVEARDPKTVLLVMEESLRHTGLAAVVGEIDGQIGLTASRRLQLAAEKSGVMGLLLRRPRRKADDIASEPTAARTRWRAAWRRTSCTRAPG